MRAGFTKVSPVHWAVKETHVKSRWEMFCRVAWEIRFLGVGLVSWRTGGVAPLSGAWFEWRVTV